jgi:hypothetical protein
MTATSATEQAVDLSVLPDSVVPAAFDRGHLYSPTSDLTTYALNPSYVYDYRPGKDFEPMPPAPRDPKGWVWWRKNQAMLPTDDFLGLRVGDEISLHSLQGKPTMATVTATYRHHAVYRYPRPVGSEEPYAHGWVNRRNPDGQWY